MTDWCTAPNIACRKRIFKRKAKTFFLLGQKRKKCLKKNLFSVDFSEKRCIFIIVGKRMCFFSRHVRQYLLFWSSFL